MNTFIIYQRQISHINLQVWLPTYCSAPWHDCETTTSRRSGENPQAVMTKTLRTSIKIHRSTDCSTFLHAMPHFGPNTKSTSRTPSRDEHQPCTSALGLYTTLQADGPSSARESRPFPDSVLLPPDWWNETHTIAQEHCRSQLMAKRIPRYSLQACWR